jgi:hypothetical protein
VRSLGPTTAVLLGVVLLAVTPLASAVPPDVSITSHPADPTSSTDAQFSFSSSDPEATFECRIDGDPYAPCTAPAGFTVTAGPHTFEVRATNASSETSVASFTWTVDLTPPSTPDITSGPSGTTGDPTPTFAFSAPDASGYVCGVDTPAPVDACGSPFTTSPLTDGAHTFYVAALDSLGNTSAAASRAFTVDTTAPALTITSGPTGATNDATPTFAFSSTGAAGNTCAVDNPTPTTACSATFSLDGAPFADCSSPTALSGLADGTHGFRVRAADGVGNVDATPAEATWAVDATPPVLAPVGSLNKTVEADGSDGSHVGFAVSASDGGAPLLPTAVTCLPASGSQFPLGRTTVTCRARDAADNVGTLVFTIWVVDTRPPSINAPDVSFTATSASGIARTAAPVVAYLAGISASDAVSDTVVSVDPPPVFPIGITKLVVTAKDGSGNTASKTVVVTVLPPGTPAPPPDLTPPRPVTAVKAKAGDHRVLLTWRTPTSDVARVEIRQSIVGERAAPRLVYRGLGGSFTSKGLRNGSAYRFVLVVIDPAGNSSKTTIVYATPRGSILARPQRGERVSTAPLLRWAPVAATYFNVQLYFGGSKVLSAWPNRARLQLTSKWTFKNRKYQLKPGVYTWYVWPGLGKRAAVKYGPLLGSSSFVVVAKKRS